MKKARKGRRLHFSYIPMSFVSYLHRTASDIDRELTIFLHKWLSDVETIAPRLLPLARAFSTACQGGKRVRGTLVKLGYELAHGTASSKILKPALAVEINQTAILAHDDIIDQSLTRRGKPTLYQALGGKHYGMSQAICFGDIGFFLAIQLLTESDFPSEYKNKALLIFTKTMLQTALGESLDILLPHDNYYLEDDVITIERLKTAQYTVVGPLQIGAVLAGADDTVLRAIRSYGEALGIAYQIQDDYLGIFADEKALGKTVGSDIKEGKVTLLITKAREVATKEQKAFLNEYYGNPNIRENDIEMIKMIFEETGAVRYAKEKAALFAGKAKEAIFAMQTTPAIQRLLLEMADFFVKQ